MKDRLNSTSSSAPVDDTESTGDDKKRTRRVFGEIDDPSLSTLKIGHHRRYLQLTANSRRQQQTSKLTLSHRKELRKLQQMISKEQESYRLALDRFHDRQKSRYLIGFESSSDATDRQGGASAFCRWACFQAQAINREWEKTILSQPQPQSATVGTNNNYTNGIPSLPKCYGKVRQTFALHSGTHQPSLDVQDLTCSVVYKSTLTTTQSSMSSLSLSSAPTIKLPEFSPKDIETNQNGGFGVIAPPSMDSTPHVQLLRNDRKALELAAKHSAAIVTTSETLEMLLRLPGDHSSKWMLPCTTTTRIETTPKSGTASTASSSFSVTILDLPIAQAFSSPRSCLETGLQEGLYQAFATKHPSRQAAETSNDTQNYKATQNGKFPFVSQVVYSLWTLPTKNAGLSSGSRKPIRVLIRTMVRLRDSVSKLPVRLRARVEYFSTPVHSESDDPRGTDRSRREIPNSYEKCLWILDQVLFGHQVFSLQYRIDPTTCEIVGWDATSVAHAFAASATTDGFHRGSNPHHSDLGPMDHWKALIKLLQSIPSIDMPETLLCLPGRIGGSKTTTNDANKQIALEKRTSGTLPTDDETKKQHERLDPFSVSVHASCEDSLASDAKELQETFNSPSTSSTGTICLDKSVLDQAGAVVLGEHALRDCRRDWEWDRSDRVPNTYPVLDTVE
jgi:hypothetical protein